MKNDKLKESINKLGKIQKELNESAKNDDVNRIVELYPTLYAIISDINDGLMEETKYLDYDYE